jgi:hypothetical protein
MDKKNRQGLFELDTSGGVFVPAAQVLRTKRRLSLAAAQVPLRLSQPRASIHFAPGRRKIARPVS